MTIEEKPEELSALVAVAMNVAPEQFPSWSDGRTAHLDALGELWSDIQPHLNRLTAKGLEGQIQQLLAAFQDGDTERGRVFAGSIYSELASCR